MELVIKENRLQELDEYLIPILLQDMSTQKNIIWGTDGYESLGNGYREHDEITVEAITGENSQVIVPRMKKQKTEQEARARGKGEVFTPAWVVNEQNNLVDAAWFGHKVVFNYERVRKWKATYKRIPFPKTLGKTWQDYVCANRIEVSCGEAPYLVSRYDVVAGIEIPVKKRIGILDRKLRIISENTSSPEEWLQWAEKALQSTYGFDWQGDNVLLARINIICSVAEAYQCYFCDSIPHDKMKEFAMIVAWNIWQMDGLKFVVPDSCYDFPDTSKYSFIDELEGKPIPMIQCPGCKEKNNNKHNGIYSLIMNWQEKKSVRFIDTIGGDE